jgi:threonine dehydrogenase-like Zn-dependent dehydrogenase
MKTKAVRLYGKGDLRLEEFELPEINDDEILAKVISDSLCMSSYKAAIQGPDHKRVPDDVDKNPIMLGHEFCGEVVRVGKDRAQYARPEINSQSSRRCSTKARWIRRGIRSLITAGMRHI